MLSFFTLASIFVYNYNYLSASCHRLIILQGRPRWVLHAKLRVSTVFALLFVQACMYQNTFMWCTEGTVVENSKESGSNVPPKLPALIGFLHKVAHKIIIGHFWRFILACRNDWKSVTAWNNHTKLGHLFIMLLQNLPQLYCFAQLRINLWSNKAE